MKDGKDIQQSNEDKTSKSRNQEIFIGKCEAKLSSNQVFCKTILKSTVG